MTSHQKMITGQTIGFAPPPASRSDVAGVAVAVVVVAGIAVMTAPNSKGPSLVQAITGGFSGAISAAVSPQRGK